MSTGSAARITALEATVAALALEVGSLRATVAALTAMRPDRDQADTDLRRLLPASTQGLPFTSEELLRHARVDGALQSALQAADIDSTASLGTWLRGRAGVQHGVAIVRLQGRGRRWQARHVDTYVSPLHPDF